MNKQRLAILAAAAVGVLATFLPWAGAMGFTVSGIQIPGGNKFFGIANLVLFGVALALSLLGDRASKLEGSNRTLAAAAGIAAGVLAIITVCRPYYGGLGVWLAILAGIALPIVAAKVKG